MSAIPTSTFTFTSTSTSTSTHPSSSSSSCSSRSHSILTPYTTHPTSCSWWNRLHPALVTLLYGTISSTSPLHMLRGQTSTLLRIIWKMYISISDHWDVDENTWYFPNEYISFPIPNEPCINVTMMPFDLYDLDSLPESFHPYWRMIQQCQCYMHEPKEEEDNRYLTNPFYHDKNDDTDNDINNNNNNNNNNNTVDNTNNNTNINNDDNKDSSSNNTDSNSCNTKTTTNNKRKRIVYLTLHQHRLTPATHYMFGDDNHIGLHISASTYTYTNPCDSPSDRANYTTSLYSYYNKLRHNLHGGIYIATNLTECYQIWPCHIKDESLIGKNGSLSHMIHHMPCTSRMILPHSLYWYHTHTPIQTLIKHVSPCMTKNGYYQFFSLYTSKLTRWDDKWSKNPLGIQPEIWKR